MNFFMIQFGYDGWEFGWVKEATAVWMEEVHYDDINDCHQFLNSFIKSTPRVNYDTTQGMVHIYFLLLNRALCR